MVDVALEDAAHRVGVVTLDVDEVHGAQGIRSGSRRDENSLPRRRGDGVCGGVHDGDVTADGVCGSVHDGDVTTDGACSSVHDGDVTTDGACGSVHDGDVTTDGVDGQSGRSGVGRAPRMPLRHRESGRHPSLGSEKRYVTEHLRLARSGR